MNRNRNFVIRMSGYALKGTSIKNAEHHNLREKEVPNADPERIKLDVELSPVQRNGDFQTYVNRKLGWYKFRGAQDTTIRKNATGSIEVVIRANGVLLDDKNHPPTDFPTLEWAKESYAWADKWFNPENHLIHYTDRRGKNRIDRVQNIYSAILHMDESTPHIHFMILPIDDRGHLNSSFYRNKEKFYSMQDSYFEAVGKQFGLERGTKYSPAKAVDISRYHTYINEVMDQEAPEIISGESIESYKVRADERVIQCHAHMRNQDVEHERDRNRLIGEKRAVEYTYIKYIEDIHEALFGYRSREFDMEMVQYIRKNAKRWDDLNKALRTYPDNDFAKETFLRSRSIYNWYREKEREKSRGKEFDDPEQELVR